MALLFLNIVFISLALYLPSTSISETVDFFRVQWKKAYPCPHFVFFIFPPFSSTTYLDLRSGIAAKLTFNKNCLCLREIYAFLKSTSEHVPISSHRFCLVGLGVQQEVLSVCDDGAVLPVGNVVFAFFIPNSESRTPWKAVSPTKHFFQYKVYYYVYYKLVSFQLFIFIEWESLFLKYEFYENNNFSESLPRSYRNLEINFLFSAQN